GTARAVSHTRSPTALLSAAVSRSSSISFFFFNSSAPSETNTLSLHDALPISRARHLRDRLEVRLFEPARARDVDPATRRAFHDRSEEHTSELQSRGHLVCRLLLEKKKNRLIRSRSSTSTRATSFRVGRAPIAS